MRGVTRYTCGGSRYREASVEDPLKQPFHKYPPQPKVGGPRRPRRSNQVGPALGGCFSGYLISDCRFSLLLGPTLTRARESRWNSWS
jgi:hypothetical protein